MAQDFDYDLMAQILEDDVSFFSDKDDPMSVYVQYPLANGSETFEPLDSERFQAFLGHRYRQLTQEPVLPDFSVLLEVQRQNVQYEQLNPVRVHHRLAGSISTGNVAYFLANNARSCVFVTKNRWKVGRSEKVKFLKGPLDKAQVMPVSGGNLLKLLRPYVNLTENDYTLFAVFVVQAFSRSSSHFAAILSSAKGTGKTTLTKLLRAIIDPSESGAALTPTSEDDLKVALSNTYLAAFDNTAALSTRFSNVVCSAITGSKVVKKTLYTTSDQTVLNLHNLIVINGIDIVPQQTDLLERSLLFELQPISPSHRKTDEEFWAKFKTDLPHILGAIFDTMVKAMSLFSKVRTTELHRMADANREMLAIALALGISEANFQRILVENVQKSQKAQVEADPLVELVVSFVGHRGSLQGPATEVYRQLRSFAPYNARFLPCSPSAFSRRLNEVKDALEQAGIAFTKGRQGNSNTLSLKKIPKNQQTVAQKKAAALIAQRQDDFPTI